MPTTNSSAQSLPSAAWLLSGASGLLGSALRRALTGQGQRSLQLVRHAQGSADEILWNPVAENPLHAVDSLEGLGVAVHLSGANVGAHLWTEDYKREMTESRVGSTAALARLLAGLRRPPATLIVASAVGIYGNRYEEFLDENSQPGHGFLAELCQQWESAAEPARAAGIRVVHLRLGVILAPRGGALQRLLPLFRLGLGGALGSGQQWMSWVGLADAVRAILFVAQNKNLSVPVNLVAPEPVRNRDFTRRLAWHLHRPALFPAPSFALRLALGQMAEETLLSSQRAFPSHLLKNGFEFLHPRLDLALRSALGNFSDGKSALS